MLAMTDVRRRTLLLVLAVAVVLSPGCGGEPRDEGDRWSTVDLALVWRLGTRGIGLCEQHRFLDAADSWQEVVDLAPFWYTARTNLGIALLNAPRAEDEAREVFEGVLEAFPEMPWAHYCLGILDEQEGRMEAAERHYRAVLAVDHDDPDTHLRLGMVLQAMGRSEEAIPHLRQSVGLDPLVLTAWYVLAAAAGDVGDVALERQAFKEFAQLEAGTGGEERAIVFGKMGFYANPIRSTFWDVPPPPAGPPAAAYSVVVTDGSREAGLDGPGLRHGGPGAGFYSAWLTNAATGSGYAAEVSGGVAAVDWDRDGDTDLFVAHWGEGPDVLALENDGSGRFEERASSLGLDLEGPARTIALAAADFDGDGMTDLFLGRAGSDLVLGQRAADGLFSRPFPGAEGPDEPTLSVAVGDVDLDGDLDLYVGGHGGTRLHCWNGRGFENSTGALGRAQAGPAFGVLLADVDGDEDLDAIAGSPTVQVKTNDRLLRFRESKRGAFPARTTAASFALGDVNGDGVFDYLLSNPSKPPELLLGSASELEPDATFAEVGPAPAFSSFLLDLDRDGDLDILTVGPEPGLYLRDGEGPWSEWTEECGLAALAPAFANARGSVLFDPDGDGDLDLFVVRNGDTPLLVKNETERGPRSDWIGVLPRGIADRSAARGKSLGPGALVEVVAGGATRTAYSALGGGFASVAPETVHYVLAGPERADVRIRWQDLVLQTEVDLAGGRVHEIEQVDREASSCPVVFYWNGRSFAYRADFLGGGGLGFLVAPGVYGIPDPEEVLLLGQDLAPREGALEVRVTEPMEEVTFLDRVHLLRVAHAEGTLAIPDERFATDGVPASGRVLVVREAERVFPTGARVAALETFDRDRHVRPRAPDPSEDAAARLARVDRSFVGPPALHRRLLGYAARWAVELRFQRSALPEGEAERGAVSLFAHGWLEYPYSRLNFAAAQEGLRAEPPSLEVPDGRGGWRVVRPEFGYMGGKSRTLVLPVGEHLAAAESGDELVFRLRTNLPLYLDQVFLAADRSATDLFLVDRIAPDSAEVRRCGFPRRYSPDGARPDLFDYSNRDRTSDFKSMPGTYTRYGEARELLLEADDRFAIFGRGEEIALRFQPPDLEVPGPVVTTWMLAARGYCKDMCPLSSSPSAVAPLPFAAMRAYPPEEPLGRLHPSLLSPLNTRVEPAGTRFPGPGR